MHCSTMLRSPRTPKPSAVYHVVFDATLQPWKVDLVDGFGRQVRHDRRRVVRNTILTVRPSEAEHRAGDIADYRLVSGRTAGARRAPSTPSQRSSRRPTLRC